MTLREYFDKHQPGVPATATRRRPASGDTTPETYRRRMVTIRLELINPRRGEVDEIIEAAHNLAQAHSDSVVNAHTVVEWLGYPRAGET